MGTMFSLVRLLDAITDPVMGSDCRCNIHSLGTFSPPAAGDMRSFAVSCVLVYSIPDFTETGKFIMPLARIYL